MTSSPDSVLPDTPEKRLLSVTALAALKGVSKQTISEKVKRLVTDGRLTPIAGKGREKLIDVAAYEAAIGAVADPAHQLALEVKGVAVAPPNAPASPGDQDPAAPAAPGAPEVDPTYRDASTREKLAKAAMAELELEERLGRVIPTADVEDAMVRCSRLILGVLDRLPLKAPELAAAVAKDGEVGARRVIKAMAFELRTAVAEAMTLQVKEPVVQGRPEAAAPADRGVSQDHVDQAVAA